MPVRDDDEEDRWLALDARLSSLHRVRCTRRRGRHRQSSWLLVRISSRQFGDVKRAWSLALFATTLLACGAATGATQHAATSGETRYPILLHRPPAEGRAVRIHRQTSAVIDVTRTVDGVEARQHVERQLECTSIRTVLATRDGQAARERHEIERCVYRDGSDERMLLPAGAVLLVVRAYEDEGPGSVSLEGGTLSDDDRAALGFTTRLQRERYDAGYGTDHPQPVGGRWPARDELCRINGAEAPGCRLRGTVTVASLEQIGGVAALWIEASAHGGGTVEADAGPTTVTLDIQLRRLLPVDLTLAELRSEYVMASELRGTAPPDEEGASAMDIVMRSRFEFRDSFEDPPLRP